MAYFQLTWNHLWFMPYLWVYSVIIIALHQPFRSFCRYQRFNKVPTPVALVFVIFASACLWINLEKRFPATHDFIHDWYNHAKYLLVFVFGFLFAQQKAWWAWVIIQRNRILLLAFLTYSIIIADRHDLIGLGEPFSTTLTARIIISTVISLNHWAWLLAVIGLAGHWLNHTNAFLRYANSAILPWYVFHQTWIIIVAWQLKAYHLNTTIEFFLLLSVTITACGLSYECARRTQLTRWLFGIQTGNLTTNAKGTGEIIGKWVGKIFKRRLL